VSTPLPDFVSDFPKAAADREPGCSGVGTARQHHAAYSSTVRHAPVPRTTTHARTMPRCPAQQYRQAGRRVENLNPTNRSQIRYEAQEALQASQGSPRGSEAILDYPSAILEAFPRQGRMAESQFRPLPVPCAMCHVPCTTYHVPRTTHGTSNDFRENRGTGVDFPSPDPIIRLGEERKQGNEGDEDEQASRDSD
jgi:hypothetical protein